MRPQIIKNQRQQQNTGPRVNERIRVPEVLVIGPDGQKIGVLKTELALQKAKSLGMDLIEVAPNVRPPVCKILDYGKYRYQQEKHKKEARKHSQATKVKEIKFRPNIAEHDYMTKLRLAEAFLDKGMKVKLSLWFKGRQMQFANADHELTKKVVDDLAHIGHCDAPPKLTGRAVVVLISPHPAQKRVRKYSKHDEIIPDDEHEEHDEPTEEEDVEDKHNLHSSEHQTPGKQPDTSPNSL